MDQFKEFWKELTIEQKVKYILITVGSIIALVFIFQNSGITTIKLFNLKLRIPLFLIMILCMAFGYLLSLMINYKKIHSLKKERNHLEKKLDHPETVDAEIIEESDEKNSASTSSNISHKPNDKD